MPAESSFVCLSSSLLGPRPHNSLRQLTTDVEQAGERQAHLKTARVYADISAQAWDLQGTFASLQTAQHLQEFYDQQRLFLQTYSASLESIREDLMEFTSLAFSASYLIPGEKEGIALIKSGVQRIVERLILTLNTYDKNYGYIFAGAQIDQKPINPKLIEDLNAPFGPELSLGNLEDYFVNGSTPKDQSPLMIYAKAEKICTLPLRANDMKSMIQSLYDFMKLSPTPSQEEVQFFHQAMNGPMDKVIDAFAQIAGYVKAFEAEEQVLQKLSECNANFRDQQLDVDPLEAAIQFHECSRTLQAFFSYLVFMVSVARQFHDLTARVMI